MMIKYKNVTKGMVYNYKQRLISELYKILCLYEEKNKNLYRHIQSFLYELSGSEYIVTIFNNNANFITLASTLESISDDVIAEDFENHMFVKSEIFKCIDIINKSVVMEDGE